MLTFGSALPALAQEPALTLKADFEAPAYQLGNIHGQQGWSVEQGQALVKPGEGRNSSAGLVLEPSAPFSQATLLLEALTAGSGPGFMDFHVAPAATAGDQFEEMLTSIQPELAFSVLLVNLHWAGFGFLMGMEREEEPGKRLL